jgi:hypothetical protein
MRTRARTDDDDDEEEEDALIARVRIARIATFARARRERAAMCGLSMDATF